MCYSFYFLTSVNKIFPVISSKRKLWKAEGIFFQKLFLTFLLFKSTSSTYTFKPNFWKALTDLLHSQAFSYALNEVSQQKDYQITHHPWTNYFHFSKYVLTELWQVLFETEEVQAIILYPSYISYIASTFLIYTGPLNQIINEGLEVCKGRKASSAFSLSRNL